MKFLMCSIVLLCALPAAGQLLLVEDFESATHQFQPDGANWFVEDGVYVCASTGNEIYSFSTAGDLGWKNYIVDVDLRVQGSYNQMLCFRVQDTSNFYLINVRGGPWNDAILVEWIDGVEIILAEVPVINSIGIWHHLRVTASDNRMLIEFDDVELIDFTDEDDPYLTGGIALVNYTGGAVQHQISEFDNVIVDAENVVSTTSETWDRVKALYHSP